MASKLIIAAFLMIVLVGATSANTTGDMERDSKTFPLDTSIDVEEEVKRGKPRKYSIEQFRFHMPDLYAMTFICKTKGCHILYLLNCNLELEFRLTWTIIVLLLLLRIRLSFF